VVNCRPILHFSIILLAFTSQSHPQTRPFERTDHPGRVAAATAPGRKATSRFFATLPDEATITAMRVGGAGNVHLAGVLKPADPKSDEDYGDAFVAQVNPDGSKLVYLVVLAGSRGETVCGLALDDSGAAYVAGTTTSEDFPTTAGSLQPTFQGPTFQAFVTKLDSNGRVVYQTLFGGASDALASDIFVNRAGEVFLTGQTMGEVLPTTPGAAVASEDSNTTFVAKLDSSGSNLLAALRGIGGKVVADARDNIYVAGAESGGLTPIPTTAGAFQNEHPWQTCFGTVFARGTCSYGYVMKLNATGTEILFSTFVTGSHGSAIAGMHVDAEGNVLLAGTTNSSDYPVTSGVLLDHYIASAEPPPQPGSHPYYFPPPPSGFITKLNSEGTALLFSTFFSGRESDMVNDMVVSPRYIYLTGYANSPDLPGIHPADQAPPAFYVSQIRPDASEATRTWLINQPGANEAGSRVAWSRDSAVYVAPGGPSVLSIDFGGPGSTERGFPRQR
jgi:hypothetical protein